MQLVPHFVLNDFDGALGRFKAGTVAGCTPGDAAALRGAHFITQLDSPAHTEYLALVAVDPALETKPAPSPLLQTKPGITRPTRKKGEIING